MSKNSGYFPKDWIIPSFSTLSDSSCYMGTPVNMGQGWFSLVSNTVGYIAPTRTVCGWCGQSYKDEEDCCPFCGGPRIVT